MERGGEGRLGRSRGDRRDVEKSKRKGGGRVGGCWGGWGWGVYDGRWGEGEGGGQNGAWGGLGGINSRDRDDVDILKDVEETEMALKAEERDWIGLYGVGRHIKGVGRGIRYWIVSGMNERLG